jgi:hypothetical protein
VSTAREGAELALKVAGAWPETKPWINATDAEAIVKQVCRASGAGRMRRSARLAAHANCLVELQASHCAASCLHCPQPHPPPLAISLLSLPQITEFLTWLKEQEEAQSKKAAHEEPAFESTMVTLRWELVSRVFERLNSKRKPRPPPAAKANATATDDKAGDKAGGGGGEQQQAEGGSGDEGVEQQQQQDGEGGGSDKEGEQQQVGDDLPQHEEL